MSDHQHNSKLKQSNRPFKGKSKGKTKRLTKGKMLTAPRTFIKNAHLRDSHVKVDRANHNKQLQKQKRDEIIMLKRLGSLSTAPKIIALVALSPSVDMAAIRRGFVNHDLVEPAGLPGSHPNIHAVNLNLDKRKQRCIFYEAPRDTLAVLDIATLADVIVLVMTPNVDNSNTTEDPLGYSMSKVLNAQGLPSIICLYQGLDGQLIETKNKTAVKKLMTRYYHTAFEGEPKVFPAHQPQDFTMVLRLLSNINLKVPMMRDGRAYMLGESASFSPGPDQAKGSLKITGYLRGYNAMSANQLIHITGYDDYQQSSLEVIQAPDRKLKDGENKLVMLQRPDQARRGLTSLAAVDPLAHEQSIITEEEIREADAAALRDAGTSDIQKVWDDLISSEDEDDEDDDKAVKMSDSKMMGPPTTIKMDDTKSLVGSMAGSMAGSMTNSVTGSVRSMLTLPEKTRLERDEQSFPDEVDTPEDGLAKIRFQKYRGLKSFKQSEWDNRESLPLCYSQISQFEDFTRTRNRAIAAENNAGPAAANSADRFVITLENVPTTAAKQMCSSTRPICCWPLLEYERKVSVLHFNVRRCSDYEAPVKGKEEMMFQIGFRRFHAQPIYSNNTPQKDKAMVQRFLQPGGFSVASVFGQVTFPPAPVLMFLPSKASSLPSAVLDPVDPAEGSMADLSSLSASSSSSSASTSSSSVSFTADTTENAIADYPFPTSEVEAGELVASGSYMGADTDRVLVKRVILTGYPVGVNKKTAIVRRMFYNADDIRWFKPVQLWTKYGLVGHIKEPRGTKGLMKVTFDGFPKNHDTVCMSLYKRQFPPWCPHMFQEPGDGPL